MPLLIALAGILLLLVLIIVLRINAFISFVVVSLVIGISCGMQPEKVILSLQTGIGNTLGSLVLILGFGAMLGKLVADSGAAQQITSRLIRLFGRKNIQTALVITGFIVGIPMFYSVGFVILVPFVFMVAASTGLPLLYVGLPMLASLSVTHGYIPPHPSPSAIAVMFHADVGKVLLYGIIIAIPAIIIAGPVFSRFIGSIQAKPLKEFLNTREIEKDKLPGVWNCLFTALLPLILISLATLANLYFPPEKIYVKIILFMGNPVVAMLISVLTAMCTLGLAQGKSMKELTEEISSSISGITMILLIIAGAGGLSQILADSGVSKNIAGLINQSGWSPIFIAWLIATIIRVCVGSATVAGLTTAGIVLPLATSGAVNRELMVLAIGSGSLMMSHINDGGFWLFKEYFSLSVKDTLLTWTIMETLVGVTGLIGVLILNMFI